MSAIASPRLAPGTIAILVEVGDGLAAIATLPGHLKRPVGQGGFGFGTSMVAPFVCRWTGPAR